MTRETMRRQAAENEYLHKDFYGALSVAIDYLEATFGPEAVDDYLRRFALGYYKPLRAQLCSEGLGVLERHYAAVIRREGGKVEFERDDDSLTVRVEQNPAVEHMRKAGYSVSTSFHKTVAIVGEALCEGSDFVARLIEYDYTTGRYVQCFRRKA